MKLKDSLQKLWQKLPAKPALAPAWRSFEKKTARAIDKTPRWLLATTFVVLSALSFVGVFILDKNVRHGRLGNGGRKAHVLADRKPADSYMHLSDTMATVKSWDQRPYFPENEFQASMKGFFDLSARRACDGITDFASEDYSGILPPGERPSKCGPLSEEMARELAKAKVAEAKPLQQDIFWQRDDHTVVRETPINATYSFFSDFDYASRQVCSGTLAPNRSPMRISIIPVSAAASYRPFACSSFNDFGPEGKKYIDAVKKRLDAPKK